MPVSNLPMHNLLVPNQSSAPCSCEELPYAAQKLVTVPWGAFGRSERPDSLMQLAACKALASSRQPTLHLLRTAVIDASRAFLVNFQRF